MAVEGLDRLRRKLAAMPAQVKRDMLAAVNLSADELVAMQRRLAPEDDGDLKASIEKRPGRHELAVTVGAGGAKTTREVRKGSGATYDYALAQEFGTTNHPPQPFFFPAYRALRRRIKGRISRAATKAAKRIAGGGK